MMRLIIYLGLANILAYCLAQTNYSESETIQISNIQQKPRHLDNLKLIFASSLRTFAVKLHLSVAKTTSESIFFSPFSISTVFAMALKGSNGNTKSQIESALSFPTNFLDNGKEIIYHSFLSYFDKTTNEKPEELTIKMSNRLYTATDFLLNSFYENNVTDNFLGKIESLNFRESENARQVINGAVERDTNNIIKDFIKPDLLNHYTKLVIVNAIYFKAVWNTLFKPNGHKLFITATLQAKNISTMKISGRFKYAQNNEESIIKLDYKDGLASMIVILPQEIDGLNALENKLRTTDLKALEVQMRSEYVEVTLPQFKLKHNIDLKEHMKGMGMTDAFSKESADFSQLTEEFIYISDAIHQSFLEVSENGTEAASASAAILKGRASRDIKTFLADHPFLFYIKDNLNDLILFFGRYMGPN